MAQSPITIRDWNVIGFVIGDDGDARALRLGLAGIGRDQVVGLIAFLLQRVGVEGAGGPRPTGEFGGKVPRRLARIGLVSRIEAVGEEGRRRLGATGRNTAAGCVSNAIATVHAPRPQRAVDAGNIQPTA